MAFSLSVCTAPFFLPIRMFREHTDPEGENSLKGRSAGRSPFQGILALRVGVLSEHPNRQEKRSSADRERESHRHINKNNRHACMEFIKTFSLIFSQAVVLY